MKLSDFIAWLQEIQAEHSDVDVWFAKYVRFSAERVAGAPITIKRLTIDTDKLMAAKQQSNLQYGLQNQVADRDYAWSPWSGIK